MKTLREEAVEMATRYIQKVSDAASTTGKAELGICVDSWIDKDAAIRQLDIAINLIRFLKPLVGKTLKVNDVVMDSNIGEGTIKILLDYEEIK